jgi:hypothetical protein
MRGYSKLHNEELLELYCTPCIIQMIKSRGMRWVGQVAHSSEMRNLYWVLVKKKTLGKETTWNVQAHMTE